MGQETLDELNEGFANLRRENDRGQSVPLHVLRRRIPSSYLYLRTCSHMLFSYVLFLSGFLTGDVSTVQTISIRS